MIQAEGQRFRVKPDADVFSFKQHWILVNHYLTEEEAGQAYRQQWVFYLEGEPIVPEGGNWWKDFGEDSPVRGVRRYIEPIDGLPETNPFRHAVATRIAHP